MKTQKTRRNSKKLEETQRNSKKLKETQRDSDTLSRGQGLQKDFESCYTCYEF